MNYFYSRILVVLIAFIGGFINSIQSQCFTPPAYCTSISASNVSNYGMGIQNVTLNTAAIPAQINNTTSPGLGSPIYFDYTSQTLTATSGAVVNYSIRGGNSNQTKIRLFIDFDNNGTFNTTPIATAGGELVLDLANMTVVNTTLSGTFTLPTLSAGSYRIRVASDGQGIIPPPCGPITYSADYEDYTLIVASGTADAIVTGIVQPTVLTASPAVNPVSFTVRNLSNTTMTSISAGYTVNGGTATTQTFTGLSIASGASYTVTFSTGFSAPALGNYTIKYFLYDVNGTTTQNSPLNDTICQTIPLLCTGPLTGSYTIDPAGGFTATNFTSFTNAVNALKACGINGPVNFSVAAGTYTDTLYIPNITGVSATNTITFDGGNGNKATRILTFPTTSAANDVVRFNSSRFVTVRNMTLRSTGTGQGWVVHFMHDSSDRVNNCNIEFTGAATSSSSSNFIAVVLNNSLTSYTTQSNICRRNIVDSNTINSGWIGISSSVSLNTATNYFLYNTISNSYQYGVYVNGNQVAKCNYNNIVPRSTTTGTSGIFFTSSAVASTHFHEVLGNKIDNAGQYGVYATSSSGQAAASNICANNMITGFRNTSGYGGIFLNSSSRWNLYHNSINCNLIATSGTTAGIYNSNSSFTDCRNNNIGISATSGTSMFPVWANTTGLFTFLNNNNYFNASSPNLLQINSVNLTAVNYKTASPANGGANSYNDNPAFVSSTNLHTTQPCFNGALGLGITTDYDGEARAGTPDIGADEIITVPSNDIQVMSITTPTFPLVAGSQPITVVIRNLGNNVVSSFDVNYRLNNGTVISEPYAGAPISPCATVVFNFATAVTIGSGSSNLQVYTSAPNGSADAVPSNDTAQWTLCNAMSGTYTINPLGSGLTNFTSFTTAIAALNCAGVNGAVTFNVSNGTYAEQLFLAPIMGASAVNTIKFQSLSGVAASCIISFSTPSSQAIIDLNGADYITFDKITIRNTFTSTCYGVWIRNGADFNTISNCIIDLNASTINGNGVYQSGSTDNRNTIISNTINGAGYGVFLNANSSTYSNRNVISNNAINGSYYFGIYTQYQDSVIISGNTITSSSANSSYSGIYAYWSQKGPIIAKNKIVFTSTYASSNSFYGMNLQYFNVNTSNPTRGLVANNMIQVGGTFSTAYGIFMQNSCNYSDIIHNSVNMTNTVTNGSYALYMNSGFSYDTVRNNIFQNIGNGTTMGYAAFIRSGTQMFYNNNDFYTTNGVFGQYNGTNYNTYALWKAAAAVGIPGFEAAGVNREVTFTSSTDLHTTLPCIADIGYNYTATSPSIAKVLDDYDGQARSTTPDLGCDEFSTAPFDVATQLMTSPTGSVFALATPYTIRTVVRNNGSTTITALDMNYSVNGGTVTSQSFTGLSLLPCDTITLTFTSPLTLTASGSNALKIFNGLINTSNADGNNTNDTLIVNLCTSYNGTYSINKNLPFSSSNFTSVSQAVNSLYSCGISGPVVLRIDAGSGPYNEQITFNGMIPGLNRTNNLRISGNTTRETITFNPTVATLQHTIRLITVKHITLDSLTINNTGGSFGVGVHLVTTADSNSVTNSNINVSLASTSFSNSAGIAISTNTSNVTTAGNNGNGNKILNNTITGGYYGITTIGTNTTTFCKNNDIINNVITGQAYYGVFSQFQDSIKINQNTIRNLLATNTSSIGIWCQYVERFEINRNNVNYVGQTGFDLSFMNFQNGTGTSRSSMVNNMIGGFFYNTGATGINLQSRARNIDINHNSISMGNNSSGSAFNISYSTSGTYGGLVFRNNSLVNYNSLSSVGNFYWQNSGLTPAVPFTAFENNNIFNANPLVTGSTTISSFGQNGYSGTSWIGASINGLNTSSSISVNPFYLNQLNDLHSLNAALSNKGTNAAGVTTDIDGQARPLSPDVTVDIGADEYNLPSNNITLVSVVSPIAPLSSGLQDIVFNIRNNGTTTLSSATMQYKVGVNGTIQTLNWTGSIAANASSNITFTGANQYNFTGSFDTLYIWSSLPNGAADAFAGDDSLTNRIICSPISGTYTVDNSLPASSTNFTSFTSLANVLNNCGITGPVIVNVAAGTYTEQFELKQYPGVSAVNTVTIQSASGIASSVNLQFNTATLAANNYVVYMNGADYTRFQNMTMTNSNTGIGSYIIWQLNNSRFNTFQNIIFNGANTSSTSQQYSIIYANNATAVQLNQGDDNNTINQCTFNNGSYGIYYNGSYSPYYTYNTTITNNTFSQQSSYATYLYFHINFNFSGNTITTSTANNFNGLYVYNGGVQANSASQFTTISKNNINITNNGTGMYLQYVNGTNTSPVIYPLVSNNFIKIGSGTGAAYGLQTSYSHANYYHNTFNVTSGSTTTPAVYLQYGCCYSPLQEFKFNIVANSGNGTNAGLCIFSDMNNTSQVKIDSNVYFQGTGATNFGSLNATNYASFAAWKTGMGATFDPASLVTNPNFVSSTNLHINSGTNLRAVPVNPLVTDDIDNLNRCGLTDVGADHHPSGLDAGVTAITSPANGVASPGLQDVKVLLTNIGSTTLTSANVSYNINGTVQTKAWTGSLATCASDTIVFTGAQQYNFTGAFTMKAFSAAPNGGADPNATNDTSYSSGCVGMGGLYTIGGTPGPTNFATFGAAITAMQGCGIGSAITFQVASGTYTEQVSIPAIVGASATNTITFEGGNGNAATRILTFATGASGSGLSHVLRFNNCSNVFFRNMTIRSSGASEAWTVHFMNGTNNRLTNCIVDMTGNGTTSTNSNFASVVINGSTTSIGTTSTTANNHRVDSCTINFGYYGIYSSINNGTLTNFFTNNNFTNTYYSGGWFQNPQTVKFNNNTINTRSTMTTAQPIFFQSVNPSGSNFNEVNGNTIVRTGQYGIYFVSTQGGISNQGQCYNNFINGMTSTNTTIGIFLNSASNWNLYHNTVNHDINSTSGLNYGIQIQNGSNNDVRNNILSTTIPTAVNWTPLFINPSSAVSAVNSNNYWNPSSSNLVNIGGVNYTSSNFKVAYPSGGGSNSINLNPAYVSSSNIHVTSACNNGENLGVLVDIDGQTRAGVPDMGADEVTAVPNNDIQVMSITTPTFPLVAGSQPVTVVIRNLGNNVVSSFDVNYRLNNGIVVTQAYTGSPISPCASANFTFSTNVTIVNGSNDLSVFTTAPNGVADVNPANDTARYTSCIAMNGTYTINASGSGPTNFTTFTAAVNSLICGGVSGPVTFNVSNGTYNEQIQIPSILGASATNTIRFQSATSNAAACILTFTPSSSGSYTLYLNGADFITFDRMTIANGYTASTVYTTWIGGSANFNTFSNCIINNPLNPNAFAVYQNGSTDNYNTWMNDTINNGGFGIYLQSNTSTFSNRNTISNCFLNNQTSTGTAYGIYVYYHDSTIITGNSITTNQTTGTYYGIYTQTISRRPIITKNRIYGINLSGGSAAYGMQHNSFASSGVGRGLIANNFISMGGTATTNIGIQMQSSSNNTDVMHNSINMTSTVLSPNVVPFFYAQSLSGNTVQNNIFQASGDGITSCAVANIGTSGTSSSVFNNNNYFSRNATTFGYSGSSNGTATASFAAFKTGAAAISNFETLGLNKEVTFVSNSDLHTSTACIKNAGANVLTIVPDDIDGVARTSTPDIGADQFVAIAFDNVSQTIVSPNLGSYALATPYTVRVRVRNNGSSTITALDMNYSLNGGAVTSQSFTGLTLLPCDTTTLTFSTTLTLTTSGSNVLKVFNGLINTSNADGNNTNDTLSLNLCTPYSGTFTINKNLPFSSSNFISVSQAVNSLYSCGMAGPVVLRIDAGSGPYNEQVTFNGMITGLSRVNNLRISGNTTRETITFNPSVSNMQHTIRLITVKHITLDSLTINNTGGSFGVGVHLVTTADSNFVTNSNINISLASTSFSNSAGIAISSNTSSPTGTGNNGNGNKILNNTITGGYYGITTMGTNTTTFCKNNDIINNVITGQAYYGVYSQFQDSTKINGNTIDNMLSSNTSSLGMELRYTERFELEKNKINRVGQYGIFLSNTNFQSGTGSVRSEISNNMIGGIFYNSNPIGLYTQTEFRNIDFWHNTIHVVNQANGYAFFMNQNSATTHSGLDFRNNTFTATNNSGAVGYFYYTNSNPFTNFLNNNIWGSNSSASQAFFSCSNYNTNGWIAASISSCQSGPNTSSCRNLDPQFINGLTDLHSIQSSLSNWGTNIGAVTSDIDGDTRPLAPSSTVDVGADEYNVPADNSGVTAVISPSAPLTPGLQNLVVQIKNYGSTTLTTANVRYKVGINGTIKSIAWTGSIATNGVSNATFTTPNQHNFTGSFDTIIAWTDGPNGQPDGFTANDTAVSITCSPLSGTYTIDTTLATGSGNFNSWASALANLMNCGVSGPVTINVTQPGTYVGTIDITNINGASAVNTITFNGVNSANRILVAATSAAAPAVLRFNNCNFVTFRNFTIRTLDASNGWCAHFFNGLNNRVTNCILDIGGAGTASTNSNLIPVVMNGNYTNSGTASTTGNNHRVDSSTLNAGYYSVYTSNSTGTSTYHFLNNTMNNAYQYGAYFNNSHAIKFNNNIVNLRGINGGTYGLYIINNNPTSPNFHEINGNKFTNIGQYGIYFATSSHSGAAMGQVYNNMISGFKFTSGNVGIFNSSSSRWNIWHNSINLDFASLSGDNNCIYLNSGGTMDVRNNILSVTSPTIVNAAPLFISATTAASALNNNLYYNASSPNLIRGAINSTASDFKLAFPAGGGLGSVNADPRFVNNATDLHTLNACNTGVNLGTTVDIDNQARSAAPDIGADETGSILNNDIGILSLNAPAFPLALGSNNVNVTLRNFGANTVTSMTVSYRVNGGALTSQTLTGLSLAPCDTMNFTFSTPFTVTGPTNFSVFTSNPNGLTDTYLNNDTANLSLCVAMSGAYSIGPAGDFSTFTQAIAQLNCAGVNGPVIFNVLSNTFTEQVTIGVIQGASATNTITFDGGAGNASSRILTFAASAANPHTFRLNGSQFINVRNLTIRSTDGVNGWPMSIVDAKNCIVSNCNIEVAGAGATATGSNLAAVVINGSRTSMSTGSSAIHNVYIDSNKIKSGYYGIYVNGNLVNANYTYTRDNAIDSAYQYGIFSNNMTHKCNNNRIYMRVIGGPTNSAGIFIPSNYTQTPDFSTYNYNQIYNARQYGIFISGSFYSNAGINQQVNNNVIGQFLGTGVTYGIYSGFSSTNEYYHNTININNAATGASRALYINNSGNITVRNNIFAITNASAATTSLPVQFTNSGSTTVSNNCYYNAVSTDIIQTTSGTFATGAVTTAYPSGGGAGSITTNPQFPAADNLRLGAAVAAATFNSTVSIASLPYDMDNNPRNPPLGTATPDMGAYDKTTSNVGVSAVISPTSVTAGNTYSITVRIRNYGTDAVSNIPVNYSLNGGAAVTETYVPTLNGNDSVSFTFTTTATFTGCNFIRCYTTLAGESFPANDTTSRNIGANISGLYTINPSGAGATNFTTFANAIAFLNCGLVTGPVTFQVAAATYTEQVVIPSTIMGVSVTNTITFDGGSGNAASRILSFATGSSASSLSHVLRFNNCSNVTFRNMTIRSSGVSEAWTVHFMNGANNRLISCIVDMTGNGTTSTNSNFASVVINGSTTSLGATSTTANNHRVDSCTINFGYYGIFSSISNGALTNFFTNNYFANTYYSGGWFQNPQTVKFNNNTINTRSTMTTAQPIYFSSANPSGLNFNEVNGNTIVRTGQYGIYFVSTQGGVSNQGQCYNNFINGMTFASSMAGIFLNSASNWNLYHNTVNHDINSTSGSNYGIQIQNGSNNDVRNNILSTTIPTAVNWTPLFINPSSAVSAVNSNNYWNPSSSNLVNIGGVNYTAANFNVAYPSGGGLNSINKNPFYVSSSNIHVTSVCNNGENLGILVDIDGDVRSSTPDIGADEAALFTVSYTSTPAFSSTGGGVDTISVVSGSTVVLSGTGANSYSWSGPQTITNAVSFLATSSGEYTVTGTTSGCTNTKKVFVKVLPSVVLTTSSTAQNGVKLTRRGVSGSLIYYGDGINYYFAIDTSGITSGSLTGDTVMISVQTTIDSFKSSNGANQEHAMYLMPRFWDAKGSFTGTVKIRFPYVPADTTLLVSLRDSAWSLLKNVTNTNTLAIKTPYIEWFKTVGVPYTAAYISGIVGNKFPSTIVKPSATYGVTGTGVHYVELAGITSFSGGGAGVGFGPGGGGGGIGLPVTWAGFDVKTLESGNELIWKTASEQNTDYFEVEYSYDAKEFQVASGRIQAAGNSASLNTYSYLHSDFNSFVYYRIKQVDLDGAFDYSTIKLAKRARGKDFQVSVYPTQIPENGRITFEAKNIDQSQVSMRMMDVTGKLVYSNTYMPTSDSMLEKLELVHLQSGVYFIEISNGQGKEVVKVLR